MPDTSARQPNTDEALASADPKLGRVIAAVVERVGRQCVTPSRAAPFQPLVRAVVHQSVSGKAAAAVFGRLRRTAGASLTPAKVLGMTAGDLAGVGLSGSKARTILNLAEWFDIHRETVKALPHLPDEEIVAALTAISGIGAWTVNVFLIFDLGRPDVMPASDRGIRRGVQMAYGLKAVATPQQVHAKSQLWRPYRSVASKYLWNAVKLRLSGIDLAQHRDAR